MAREPDVALLMTASGSLDSFLTRLCLKMYTLVSKLVALSVEKYYMALTEIQLQVCTFHGSLSQKGSRSLLKCIGVFVIYLNITERSSQLRVLLESYTANKVVRTFYFALRWLGNFKTSGCLVGRPTCAPATTRLTPQVVGISTITYNLRPYTCKTPVALTLKTE